MKFLTIFDACNSAIAGLFASFHTMLVPSTVTVDRTIINKFNLDKLWLACKQNYGFQHVKAFKEASVIHHVG